jgi:hypothetical protein
MISDSLKSRPIDWASLNFTFTWNLLQQIDAKCRRGRGKITHYSII